MQEFLKDPDATLDYSIDWSLYLVVDTISAVTWTVPTGITKVSDSHTTTVATAWLSGGTAGADYPVTCRVTTVGGRVDDRTILIRVRQR
jgi:hypothetical protein